LLFRRDAASLPLHPPVLPLPLADLEELRQHGSLQAPGFPRESGNLRQRHVVVRQLPTAPQVEEK
jgi:hypothetical protein